MLFLTWTRLLFAPARLLMCSPATLEPTNETPLMIGSSHKKFTAS